MKVYLCRCAPYEVISAFTDIASVREWWVSNQDSAGTRQVRLIRWSETRPYTQFFEDDVPSGLDGK